LNYHVRHRTTYHYEDAVSVSHHLLHLTPRNFGRQTCRESHLSIVPAPQVTREHRDYFGNLLTSFTLDEPHECLIVEANSDLEVSRPDGPDFSISQRWDSVRDAFGGEARGEMLDAYQFVFDSQRVSANPQFAAYARASFPDGRPLLEAALDLTHRIHQDFLFDKKATEVATPVASFFEKRRGVCQDFAHFEIACLRSLGLAARYVSGYLRTIPPPGRPRLRGADASHAWCSAWCAEAGWVDFDPTNDCVPADGHITLAWGRDYSDVSPIYGVLRGGARHRLQVEVDVEPVG